MSSDVTRESFLALALQPAAVVEPVELPGGKGTAYVRVMNGFERDSYEESRYQIDSKTGKIKFSARNARGELVARTLCDASGKRLFPNDGEADILGRADARILDAIFAAAKKLNGMTGEEDEALEGNSGAGVSGDSGSASPAISDVPSEKPSNG
ncbi:hypothetical protein AYO44_03815 [Planctomycetaceae bacterium SCGC AG-212-F19]|nr:hypothetical protein AYO44_03815 [Planctomycetaceae bacterium SCGC AG-212-F19]